MAVLSRRPEVGFLAQFSEKATMHGVCSYMNNYGSLMDEFGNQIPDFQIWPGPVPEDAHLGRQIGIPNNPLSATRNALDIEHTID